MKRSWIWLVLVALVLVWPVASVSADGPAFQFDEGQIFVDEDVSLQPGQTFNGDLGLFNGDLDMPSDSTVNGDLFITNGDADIAGQVNGNVAVIDGDLELSSTGQVNGDLFAMSGDHDVAGHVRGDMSVLFGDLQLRSTALVDGDLLVTPGNVEREAGAQVRGDEVYDLAIPPLPFVPRAPEDLPRLVPPTPPELPRITPPSPPRIPEAPAVGMQIGRFFGRVLTSIFLSILFIALGLVVAFIWPRNTRQVSDCITAAPLQCFGLGLLTFFIALGLEALAMVLMIVVVLVGALLIGTIILIPVGLLLILASVLLLLPVPLALVGAVVLGWVGLAEMVGQKVLRALRLSDVTPAGAALFGLLLTVCLAAALWAIQPLCCGWPFALAFVSLGLGAVFHTRFGTQSCRSTQPGPGGELLPLEAMEDEAGWPDNPAGRMS